MITKIISGGQTGADLGGLKAAKILGIETGGFAPKNYQTEQGPNLELKTLYSLVDVGDDYVSRTIKNVKISDATVVFSTQPKSVGTLLTLSYCAKFKKPFILNPFAGGLRMWLEAHPGIRILNVAGNRASVDPDAEERTKLTLIEALNSKEGKEK